MNTPYAVAAVRSILTAIFTGATTFLATWATTDDPKTLIITTGTVVIGVLVSRFGVEGTIDTKKSTG